MIDDGAKHEILQAIAALDVKLTGRIEHVESGLIGLTGQIGDVETRLTGQIGEVETRLTGQIGEVRDELIELIQDLSTSTDERFNEINAKIDRARAEMPTKDYIDRKFADYDQESSNRAERMFVRR